jgi:hypothetical protein
MTSEDECTATRLNRLAQILFVDSRRLAAEMNLPVEIVDADILLDGRHAILQYLGRNDWEMDSFVSGLPQCEDLAILLENVASPAEKEHEAEEHGGCGEPNCGRASGGCSSCGSGGCSSCGSGKVDMRAYFSHLRSEMERRRTPLLG